MVSFSQSDLTVSESPRVWIAAARNLIRAVEKADADLVALAVGSRTVGITIMAIPERATVSNSGGTGGSIRQQERALGQRAELTGGEQEERMDG